MSSKNRKVYQMGDRSIREFFSSPTRYLAEAISKESEFEKPYLDDDRGRMHSDPSWPDWPPFPEIPPWPPLPDIPDGPTPGLSLCAITCYAPSDCDEPIWCHPSIWCGTDLGCTLCEWIVEGATSGYSSHLTGVGGWGIDIWIDTDLVEPGGEALVHVQMKDPCGNLCGEDIEVTCKKCPPEIAISWPPPPINPETAARNATVGVTVKDGLGPYSWSVAGTGFTMTHAQTDGVLNSVIADGSACGTATITVTDDCGGVVVGYVRCTTGRWIWKSADVCQISGTGTFIQQNNPHCEYELIIDNKRQRQGTRNIGICTGDNCCDPYCNDAVYCVTGISCTNCIDPFASDCWPYTQFPHGYLVSAPNTWRCFCPGWFDYHEWEC